MSLDLQTIISNQLAAARAESLKTSPILTLGELIAKLEAIPLTYKGYKDKDALKTVRFNFEYVHPTRLMSWRGVYAELAYGFAIDGDYPTLSDVLMELRSAIGKTFEGYKGGEYVMGKATPIWVANCGNSGDTGIVGVEDDDYCVILLTARCKV